MIIKKIGRRRPMILEIEKMPLRKLKKVVVNRRSCDRLSFPESLMGAAPLGEV
jgi:hypothetical protein